VGYGLVPIPDLAFDLEVAINNLLHARFDGRQVI
jgi:hypothetical protein